MKAQSSRRITYNKKRNWVASVWLLPFGVL